jgi:hypothetical protein
VGIPEFEIVFDGCMEFGGGGGSYVESAIERLSGLGTAVRMYGVSHSSVSICQSRLSPQDMQIEH